MLKKLITLAIAAGFAGATLAAGDATMPPATPKAGTAHHMKGAKHHQHHHVQRHHHQHMASAK